MRWPTAALRHVPPALSPGGAARLFLAGSRAGYSEHLQAYGSLDIGAVTSGFIGVLEASGLTGRGGAAFASWRKMAAAADSGGRGLFSPRPVVIANGAEGEPLSHKDAALLANAPHLVLDGVLVAAAALQASRAYIYVTPETMSSVQSAVAERRDARHIRPVKADDTFISGEASAVVNRISGGPSLPMDKRRRLSDAGLKGRPTLVLNVESLAHIGLLARFGVDWFRSSGTARDPGTRLVTVAGAGPDQVLEVAGDASLHGILRSVGIGPEELSAVLIGGYHGRWVRPLDYRLSPSGPIATVVRPGAGVIYVLHADQCGLAATAQIAGYLADQSARQCGPCMFGLPAMAGVLNRLAYGERNSGLVTEIERLGGMVTGRGSCHHPGGTVRMVSSALETFSEDVKEHLSGRCTRVVRGARHE
ncbi:NADH-ubiquinone oxidoreductase-F iron-sulfur binding region domain-containing protein [Arthrobacter sp. NPDC055138]